MQDKPRPTYTRSDDPLELSGPGAPLRLPEAGYVLVVAGSPQMPSEELLAKLSRSATAVIAVDSGAFACQRAGVVPSLLLGDLDSIPQDVQAWCEERDVPCNTTVWEKDETDLEIALRFVSEKLVGTDGGPSVVLAGALGGRLDHELAVLGTVARYPQLRTAIVSDDELCLLLDAWNRTTVRLERLGCVHATTFSVVALGESAIVSEMGMRWDLEDAELEPLSDHGVSNFVVDPLSARVSVHAGRALLIIPRGESV